MGLRYYSVRLQSGTQQLAEIDQNLVLARYAGCTAAPHSTRITRG